MTTTIILTPTLRELAFFENFSEESVEVPDKPFLRELLENALLPEDLSIQELSQAIETCIYFSLDSAKLTGELLWKIGEGIRNFRRWFVKVSGRSRTWKIHPRISPLIRLELEKTDGAFFDETRLIQLGIRQVKDLTCTKAAQVGNLRLLRWTHEQGLPWNRKTMDTIAQNGHLDCLKYAHEQGVPWNEWTCASAVNGGFLNCLEYLHEQGCPWDKWTCREAVTNERVDCLKYALEQGCPKGRGLCAIAAREGRLECLKLVYEYGCALGGFDNDARYYAILGGHLDCLKYGIERGGPADIDLYVESAIELGRLSILKYLREQGCSWNDDTAWTAARHGQLECLKYLHDEGCPWDEDTTAVAAAQGHLECLKYLHEQGCPWDTSTYGCAIEGGHDACVAYLLANGCPQT